MGIATGGWVFRLVSISHDIGNQGVASGNDRKLNPQVCVPFPGAGHRLDPDHALKVETRVRTPLGLQAKPPVRASAVEAIGSLNDHVNDDSNAEYPENIPSQIVPS
jgi:hypothetical protein